MGIQRLRCAQWCVSNLVILPFSPSPFLRFFPPYLLSFLLSLFPAILNSVGHVICTVVDDSYSRGSDVLSAVFLILSCLSLPSVLSVLPSYQCTLPCGPMWSVQFLRNRSVSTAFLFILCVCLVSLEIFSSSFVSVFFFRKFSVWCLYMFYVSLCKDCFCGFCCCFCCCSCWEFVVWWLLCRVNRNRLKFVLALM